MKCPHCHKGWRLHFSREFGAYEIKCYRCNGTGKASNFEALAYYGGYALGFLIVALVAFNVWRYFYS